MQANSQQAAIHMKSLSPHTPHAHSIPHTTPKVSSVGLGIWGTLPFLSPLKAAPASMTTKSPHSSVLQISFLHPSTLSVHRPLGASQPQHPRDTAKGLTHGASRAAARHRGHRQQSQHLQDGDPWRVGRCPEAQGHEETRWAHLSRF